MKDLKQSSKSTFLWILALTILFETLTCFLRFGLDLQSTRDTSMLRSLTFGFRIHHGYVGVIMVLLSLLLPAQLAKVRTWVFRIGMALVLSDLAHHFLVLWPITGDPKFDLLYPN